MKPTTTQTPVDLRGALAAQIAERIPAALRHDLVRSADAALAAGPALGDLVRRWCAAHPGRPAPSPAQLAHWLRRLPADERRVTDRPALYHAADHRFDLARLADAVRVARRALVSAAARRGDRAAVVALAALRPELETDAGAVALVVGADPTLLPQPIHLRRS